VTDVLEEVADQHRGEAVLVVSHGGAIMAAVTSLAGLAPERARGLTLPNCAAVELEADGKDWRLVSWDGPDATHQG
jgi:broad specificity phosphatase PhoE